MRTAVALGSNLGDRLASLRAARRHILHLMGVMPPILSSGVYETDPIGCEAGAHKFLNTVMEFDYEGDPFNLWERLAEIETVLGRPRAHPRNVSRIIDIDLLYVGNLRIQDQKLQLPHPRMRSRKFVLRPLADIRAELILADQTKTVWELLAQLKDSCNVVRLTIDWCLP